MQIDWNKSDEELQKDLQEAEEGGRKNSNHVKRVLFAIFSIILLCIGGIIIFVGYEAYQGDSFFSNIAVKGVYFLILATFLGFIQKLMRKK